MNIVSVSWGDHLVFGEADGRLETEEAVARRMRAWRDELGATALHWRALRERIPGRFSSGRGYRHPSLTAARSLGWDDFAVVPALAHDAGLEAWLYVTLFDEGWPLPPPRVRAVSYHNAMHGRHVAWQSDLTRAHPEWVVVDRSGRRRQWGVVSCAYPAARRAFIRRWLALLAPTRFDGLFVCLRSQSRPADQADQFGHNRPVRAAFRERYGIDPGIRDFDRQAWRDLCGESLTTLLAELREALAVHGRTLGIGVARGDVLGPPLGNTTLCWREWVRRGLIDQFVVGQNSSQCPSMWHQLWPMHRGTGYVQNYLDGTGLPPLAAHLRDAYGPAIGGTATRLYVARQWHPRCTAEERELGAIPGVAGLVFSSFRHDNPNAIARGDWTAGRVRGSGLRRRPVSAGPRVY
ncbi:MAG: hypothetical protein A3I61_01545 [Acidobacteria bacterium RIFCSPLOWO2_02_FULL_68_18]|nr:MAG: hypothetical protein A3I61_01545 [Acidobacteria bacterium RIFCSPLOWO2_02_FULL_68_18]OFW47906.1 MAG: hypothetical protein A3G77_00110 [Acidobacteria bacterium RIFCSPLOWO2_12_FULL_68_19]